MAKEQVDFRLDSEARKRRMRRGKDLSKLNGVVETLAAQDDFVDLYRIGSHTDLFE